ncbi:MAG: M28 family peptidase [Bacteroidetes bacterium]|nr:M28 family peptidase [Bacteroidota bacterium]
MKNRILPFVFSILISHFTFSQSEVLKYAHQIVDTLASPTMHGRGYVNKGDSIAADYIKKEFEKFGLKPIGKEFEQRFSFPMYTFPGNMEVKLDKQILIPGKDFIVKSIGKSPYLTRKIIYLNKGDSYWDKVGKKSQNKLEKKFAFIVDSGAVHEVDSRVILDIKTKLTWGFEYMKENSERDWTIFEIKKDVIKNTPRKISIKIDYKYYPNYQSQNILGYIKGIQYPDSFIVFSAHYDHLGQMGKDVYFPGANDNASGCAMLLNLAKYYSQHPPKYSVAFMAFGGEEVGLLGSKYYVEHPLFPLKQIKFLVNMDIMGTGDEGIKVVNATEHKKEFDELVKINSEKNLLPVVSPRGKAANSDHYFFEEAGVKTFFIYTLGGIKAYHDIYDRPETLPLTKFEEVYNLLLQFTDYLQK